MCPEHQEGYVNTIFIKTFLHMWIYKTLHQNIEYIKMVTLSEVRVEFPSLVP